MFHYNVSRYANLIQDCMDSMDRHELVIVETDGMTIVETRCWFSVPFHTAPWSCDTNVSHRSQVSEWKVQRWASIRHRDHRLMACSSWTSLDMVKCISLLSALCFLYNFGQGTYSVHTECTSAVLQTLYVYWWIRLFNFY